LKSLFVALPKICRNLQIYLSVNIRYNYHNLFLLVYVLCLHVFRIDSFESEGSPSEGIEEPIYAKSNILKGSYYVHTFLVLARYRMYSTDETANSPLRVDGCSSVGLSARYTRLCCGFYFRGHIQILTITKINALRNTKKIYIKIPPPPNFC
jgi:hypothetical protein